MSARIVCSLVICIIIFLRIPVYGVTNGVCTQCCIGRYRKIFRFCPFICRCRIRRPNDVGRTCHVFTAVGKIAVVVPIDINVSHHPTTIPSRWNRDGFTLFYHQRFGVTQIVIKIFTDSTLNGSARKRSTLSTTYREWSKIASAVTWCTRKCTTHSRRSLN